MTYHAQPLPAGFIRQRRVGVEQQPPVQSQSGETEVAPSEWQLPPESLVDTGTEAPLANNQTADVPWTDVQSASNSGDKVTEIAALTTRGITARLCLHLGGSGGNENRGEVRLDRVAATADLVRRITQGKVKV